MRSKYQRIAADLRDAIAGGDYPPGATLPAITTLMEQYEVARETVRSAVAVLANEGLVTPLSGVGTVVRDLGVVDLHSTPATPHPEWSTTSGEASSTRTLEAEQTTADREIADRLGIAPGDVVVRRLRQYLKGRDVVLLHEQWITGDVATAIQEQTGYDTGDREAPQPADLYTLMKQAGHPPTSTTEAVTTRMPSPAERDTMNMPAGVPVLVTQRVTEGASGIRLETSDFVGCGDRSTQRYTVPIQN